MVVWYMIKRWWLEGEIRYLSRRIRQLGDEMRFHHYRVPGARDGAKSEYDRLVYHYDKKVESLKKVNEWIGRRN